VSARAPGNVREGTRLAAGEVVVGRPWVPPSPARIAAPVARFCETGQGGFTGAVEGQRSRSGRARDQLATGAPTQTPPSYGEAEKGGLLSHLPVPSIPDASASCMRPRRTSFRARHRGSQQQVALLISKAPLNLDRNQANDRFRGIQQGKLARRRSKPLATMFTSREAHSAAARLDRGPSLRYQSRRQ